MDGSGCVGQQLLLLARGEASWEVQLTTPLPPDGAGAASTIVVVVDDEAIIDFLPISSFFRRSMVSFFVCIDFDVVADMHGDINSM